MKKPTRILRGLAVLAVCLSGVVGGWRWGASERAAAAAPGATLSDLIAGAAGAVLPLALLWLSVLVVLVVAEPLTGRDLTRLAGCPPALRRLLLTLIGVAVAGALSVPAQAGAPLVDGSPARPGDQAAQTARTARVPGLLDGLPLPERPVGAAPGGAALTGAASSTGAPTGSAGHARTASTTSRSEGDDSTITVRRGDSLWRITDDRMTDGSDREVVRAVAQLYAANRDRIGDDPDLILPGTILRSTAETDDSQEDPS